MKKNNLALTMAVLFAATAYPPASEADTFVLHDGARLEGEITGKTDNSIMIKTKYGNLTLKDTDITQIIKKGEEKADIPEAEEGIEVINSKDLDEASATYVFSTVPAEDGSSKIFYFRNTEIIATEILDTNSNLVSVSGKIPDRTFTQYYENSKIQSVKTMKNGKPEGPVYSYYSDGTKQFEGNYSNGIKNGTFIFFAPNGLPLIKANYKNDMLDGPKYEYDMEGKISKITWYKNDELTDAPADAANAQTQEEKPITAADQAKIQPAADAVVPNDKKTDTEKTKNKKQKAGQKAVSVKAKKVARGNIYSFYRNNRYIGKALVDNDHNVISIDGKVPDGVAKMYGKNDTLQIEFVFKNKDITNIILYDEKGQEKEQYSINEKGAATKLGI